MFPVEILPWSGRGSRIWSWRGQGWVWRRTRCWPAWRWSARWSCSVQWPGRSRPSSPESPSAPGGCRRPRCSRESTAAAPRPLTPLWTGSPARRLSSPACRSVTDSCSLRFMLQGRKTQSVRIYYSNPAVRTGGSLHSEMMYIYLTVPSILSIWCWKTTSTKWSTLFAVALKCPWFLQSNHQKTRKKLQVC